MAQRYPGVEFSQFTGGDTGLHRVDEAIRFHASMEAIANGKRLTEGGVITAANASQICAGDTAVLVVSERAPGLAAGAGRRSGAAQCERRDHRAGPPPWAPRGPRC
jgi:acetyl-CoA acetyltransferase